RPFASLDRVLPRKPWPFVATGLGIAIALWALGGALAGDRARWLASREWQVQPLYLAMHLALVRMFVTSYTANFLAGCAYLRIDEADVRRRVRRAVGWRTLAIAAVVAAPLVALDVTWITTEAKDVAELGLGRAVALGA